ncbi:MAG: hypothetical protein FD124_1067 [Alphaproteobacteria bacterium]|nr:MAG: hypothetical protein FD160_3265 [Caulobacteraceae bacterium]TPW07543.1 MAG: hypothetical protein FD124_1067 [Alphaproteobacteria bacterium]
MREVGVLEAKTHLSALLDEVEAGGEIVITRHGRPVARLSPPRRFTPRAHLRTEEEKAVIRAAADRLGEIQARTSNVPFDWKEAVEEGRE